MHTEKPEPITTPPGDIGPRAGSPAGAFLLITGAAAAVAFLLAPQAPLGRAIWPTPVDLDPEPAGAQLVLFSLLGLIEALAFGAGLAVLALGGRVARRFLPPDRAGLATIVRLSLFWLLWSWWLHDGLHMVIGLHTGPLLVIEYVFHVTLIAAGGVLAYALTKAARRRGGAVSVTAGTQ